VKIGVKINVEKKINFVCQYSFFGVFFYSLAMAGILAELIIIKNVLENGG